jgi:hypothetical protein
MKARIKRPQEQEVKISLPRIGMIKTGFKSPNGYPQSVDYFIPTGVYQKYFTDAYGPKPSIVQIVFISDDPRVSCNERYEYRDEAGALFAVGDGETFRVWSAQKQNYITLTTTERPNLLNEVASKCKSLKGWEVTLTLKFICPRIKKIAGYWQYTTKGSASTIPQIREAFDYILETNGTASGVCFDLSVQFAKSNKPGSKSKYPVTSLIANENEANLQALDTSFINTSNKQLKSKNNG